MTSGYSKKHEPYSPTHSHRMKMMSPHRSLTESRSTPSAPRELGTDFTGDTMTIRQLADIVESRYGNPEQFIANVRIWLHQFRITQSALAETVGLDSTNLNRWMNGHIRPSLKNMLLLDEGIELILNAREES